MTIIYSNRQDDDCLILQRVWRNLTNVTKIYAIYKKKPFTKGDWFQSDSREFANYNECIKEAKKLGGVVLIKRVKTENGWEQIEI